MKQELLHLVETPKNENCTSVRIFLVESRKFFDEMTNEKVFYIDLNLKKFDVELVEKQLKEIRELLVNLKI